MSDDEYTDLMVWHRGLAVPAVRDIGNPEMARGKKIFEEIGCAYCHRPSWQTGADRVRDPARFFAGNELPRYPYQTIWPYTDMVQHKLHMANDIRTGWCRTTPLWGPRTASEGNRRLNGRPPARLPRTHHHGGHNVARLFAAKRRPLQHRALPPTQESRPRRHSHFPGCNLIAHATPLHNNI